MLAHDIRLALRSIVRTPWLSLLIVLAIAAMTVRRRSVGFVPTSRGMGCRAKCSVVALCSAAA